MVHIFILQVQISIQKYQKTYTNTTELEPPLAQTSTAEPLAVHLLRLSDTLTKSDSHGQGNVRRWKFSSGLPVRTSHQCCTASLSSCLHLSHEVAQYLLCLRFDLRTMARTCNGSLPASSTVSQSGWPSFVHICMKDDHTYIAFFLFVIALVTLKGRHPSAIRQLAKCSRANDMLTRTKNAGMTRKDYDEFLGRC